MTEQRPPRVFISYSHDSEQHADRVLALADRLRAEGIEAALDQYEISPAEGWPVWCESQIEEADFVLLVCTETYHRRVSGKEELGKGHGVLWEARIIRQSLYDAGSVSSKFIPVLFSNSSPDHIPRPVKGATHHFVDTDRGYEDLYRQLTNQRRARKRTLGKLRSLPSRDRQWREQPAAAATKALGELHNVPDLPPNFVARPDDIAPVKALLLGNGGGTVGITGSARKAGLLGMGGIGKTVLATALVRDQQVRERFPDGSSGSPSAGRPWSPFGRPSSRACSATARPRSKTGNRAAAG